VVTPIRTNMQELDNCACPLIMHVNDNHFITYLGKKEDRLILFDNGIGLFDCTRGWFTKYYRWDGAAIMLGPPSPGMALSMYGRTVFCHRSWRTMRTGRSGHVMGQTSERTSSAVARLDEAAHVCMPGS
jgi:hypothetical protein